jgi:hypothetical protein
MNDLIDKINELKLVIRSLEWVTKNEHTLKSNRINSLKKKKHDLASSFRRTLKSIDAEIERTRNQDYS